MIKVLVLITFLCSVIDSNGQQEVDQDWNAFSQPFDVIAYRGGEFRFKGFVKTESTSKTSNARLWVRVDKKKGTGFFDNMHGRPIMVDKWTEYLIGGPIHKNAIKLLIGGLYFGTGKYYYDNFSLEVKKKGGDWERIQITNDGFELETFNTDWKSFYKVPGFSTSLISVNAYDGKYSLLIDGSARTDQGKFVDVNGISIHYEEHGKGDTVLLLHGNSESIKSFSKQIPELSKSFFLIAMDSRGQGYSTKDGKKMTYDLMAEDVNEMLAKLNLKHVNVLGWSDGGIIGLMLAMKYPDKVKRLAIMGANLYNDNTSIDGKINKLLKKDRKTLVMENNQDNDFRIEMIDLMLNEPNINPDDLKSIACPTLVMAGSNDVIKENHTRLIASKIKNSKLKIFDKGTHYEPSENPERFNKTVTDFFSKR